MCPALHRLFGTQFENYSPHLASLVCEKLSLKMKFAQEYVGGHVTEKTPIFKLLEEKIQCS